MEQKRLINITFRWADNVLARIEEEGLQCEIKFDGQSLKIIAEGEAADRIDGIDREESEKFLFPDQYVERLLQDHEQLKKEFLDYTRSQRNLHKKYRETFYENQKLHRQLEKIKFCDTDVLKVDLMMYALQDETDLICEVYRCEDNVVLMDGGYFPWKPENLILRGNGTAATADYSDQRIYRWDLIDGVLKICLGPVPDPSERTLDYVKEWLTKYKSNVS